MANQENKGELFLGSQTEGFHCVFSDPKSRVGYGIR
jgi:hypothetical protein